MSDAVGPATPLDVEVADLLVKAADDSGRKFRPARFSPWWWPVRRFRAYDNGLLRGGFPETLPIGGSEWHHQVLHNGLDQ
jgi:hypothetical protein